MFCTSFSFLPAPATGSIGVLINKAFEKCQKQYLKIKSQSPVFNVIKIVLDPLGDGCIATVAIHLRPPGHTRTYLMLDHVTRDLFLEAFYKIWTLRPWSHQAHAAKQPVYSRGLGALGLPGDLSSQSRFVRAAFVRMNAKSGSSEAESVGQFFHILHAVEQQRGCCELDGGKYEITLYTSCCNTDKGIYYYTTYGNHQITAVDMHRENLDGDRLVRYPLVQGEQIALQN